MKVHIAAGADKLDDGVKEGVVYRYVWDVLERSGPGPADASSVVWMYHSHHQEVKDTISGLYGAMIISRRVRYCRPIHCICSLWTRIWKNLLDYVADLE